MELPKEITSFLDKLTEVEHDRLLTTPLIPHCMVNDTYTAGCLMGVAFGMVEKRHHSIHEMVGRNLGTVFAVPLFNALCAKDPVGTGAAIRDYICELRTTRELATVPVKVYPMSEARVVRASL